MSFAVKIRYILKVISAAAWVIILTVTYACTSENLIGLARTIQLPKLDRKWPESAFTQYFGRGYISVTKYAWCFIVSFSVPEMVS